MIKKILTLLLCCLASIPIFSQSEDIYHLSEQIDTFSIKSKYFSFPRKVFVRLPASYSTLNAYDYDVIYTVDAQTSSQFLVECGMMDFVDNHMGYSNSNSIVV